jgi:hypothetical protein
MIRKTPLALLALQLLVLVSCAKQIDFGQFVTKESYREASKNCEGSNEKGCLTKTSYQKVDAYCSANNIAANKCNEIKLTVMRKTQEFQKERIDELRRATEGFNELNRDLKNNTR